MAKQVGVGSHVRMASQFSEAAESDRHRILAECRELTNALFDGLDVAQEMCAVADQALGDSVLLGEDSTLVGFAICHCGPGSEGGSATC